MKKNHESDTLILFFSPFNRVFCDILKIIISPPPHTLTHSTSIQDFEGESWYDVFFFLQIFMASNFRSWSFKNCSLFCQFFVEIVQICHIYRYLIYFLAIFFLQNFIIGRISWKEYKRQFMKVCILVSKNHVGDWGVVLNI